MSSSTSKPPDDGKEANNALPSDVPNISVQHIDPATAPAELQSVLSKIADDMRKRTGGKKAGVDETSPETSNQSISREELIELFHPVFHAPHASEDTKEQWKKDQEDLPERIDRDNFIPSLRTIASSRYLVFSRLGFADLPAHVKTVLNGGVALPQSLDGLWIERGHVFAFEAAAHAAFSQVQQRLSIPTVDAKQFLETLRTYSDRTRDKVQAREKTLSLGEKELQSRIIRVFNELTQSCPAHIDFLEASLISLNAVRNIFALLERFSIEQVQDEGIKSRLFLDIAGFSRDIASLLIENFPDAEAHVAEFLSYAEKLDGLAGGRVNPLDPAFLVADASTNQETVTGAETQGGAEVQEKFVTRAEVVDRLMEALNDSDRRLGLAKNSQKYIETLTRGLRSSIPEKVRSLGDLGRAIYFLMARIEAVGIIQGNTSRAEKRRKLDIRNKNRLAVLGEIRTICIEIHCAKDFDAIFPALAWSTLPDSFDEGPTLHCQGFIEAAQQEMIDAVESYSHTDVELSNLAKSKFNKFILTVVPKLRIFAETYCHEEISFGQLQALFAFLCEAFSNIENCIEGISKDRITIVRQSIDLALTTYFNAQIVALDEGGVATVSVSDDTTADVQVLEKSIGESSTENLEQAERKSITIQEIVDLWNQTIKNALGVDVIPPQFNDLIENALRTCPDVIDQDSYGSLFSLSQMCVARSMRVAQLDLDAATMMILSPGSTPQISIPPSAEVIQTTLQVEKAMQSFFATLQNKLTVPTIDRNEFVREVGTLIDSCEECIDRDALLENHADTFYKFAASEKLLLELFEALPENIDVLQAQLICDASLANANAQLHLTRQIIGGENATKFESIILQLERDFDTLLASEFAEPAGLKTSTEANLEGTGPVSRQVFCETFCDAISRASFSGADIHPYVQYSRDAIAEQCPEIISNMQDLHKFLLWFATQMALLRKGIRNETGVYSLELPSDDEIVVHFSQIFRKIGERFGVSNFALNAASISSIATTTGTPISAAKAKTQILNILKPDTVHQKVVAVSQSIAAGNVEVQQNIQCELTEYIEELKRLITQFLLAWLPDGIRSTNECKMIASLMGSSIGQIVQRIKTDHGDGVAQATINFWQGIETSLGNIYTSWETSLQTSANVSGVQADAIDTPTWYANKISFHDLPVGAEPTWESGRLTAQKLKTDVQTIFVNAKDYLPELASDPAVPPETYRSQCMPHITAFRRTARTVIDDLTKKGPINTPEQYGRLVGGFGHAVDSVPVEPLRQYFAQALQEWFAENELMSKVGFMQVFSEAFGALPTIDMRDALVTVLSSSETDTCLEAAAAFNALLPTSSTLQSSASRADYTTFIQVFRKACEVFMEELHKLDPILGPIIAAQYEQAFQSLEAAVNPDPSPSTPTE